MADTVLTFVKKFDPSQKEHIDWLKEMVVTEAKDYLRVLRNNPLGIDSVSDEDVFHWAQIYMCLCSKYVKYTFTN